MPKRALLVLAVLLALQAPWLARPPHYDEANFLVLAEGARADPWRPHDVRINWQGTEERAFDVLSNPPGIAWWLAPVLDLPIAAQRAWMLAWLPLAVAGAWKLGRRFLGDPAVGALVLCTSPIVLLSTPALLPDAPLWSLTLLGVGGFVEAVDGRRRAWPWALLAGCAALFRYSGLALAPVLAGYALLTDRRRAVEGLAALLPLALLGLHDLHAYGAIHLFAMGKFQSVADTPGEVGHKLVASIAMLGGAAALPVFRWGPVNFVGAALGALAGLPWGWPGALFAGFGGASLAELRRDTRLAAWAGVGLVFLATLRFAATRYWLPFLAPVLLVRRGKSAIVLQVLLGTALAADEQASARAQVQLAEQVAQLGTGVFTGHWGWQWAMERRGWRAAEEGATPRDTLVAMPRQAWPQHVEVRCNTVVWEGEARPPWPWLPRGYSEEGGANLHASWIAGPPMRATIAPWTFADDPYERVRVCRE